MSLGQDVTSIDTVLRAVGANLDHSPGPRGPMHAESRTTEEPPNTNVQIDKPFDAQTRLAQGSAADLQFLTKRTLGQPAGAIHPDTASRVFSPAKRKRADDGDDREGIEHRVDDLYTDATEGRRQSRNLMPPPPPPPQPVRQDIYRTMHSPARRDDWTHPNSHVAAQQLHYANGPFTPNHRAIGGDLRQQLDTGQYDVPLVSSKPRNSVHSLTRGSQPDHMPSVTQRADAPYPHQRSQMSNPADFATPFAGRPLTLSAQRRQRESFADLGTQGSNGFYSTPYRSSSSLGLSRNARSSNKFSPRDSLDRTRQPLGGTNGASPHFSARQLPSSVPIFDQYLNRSDTYSKSPAIPSSHNTYQPQRIQGGLFPAQAIQGPVHRSGDYPAEHHTYIPYRPENPHTPSVVPDFSSRLRRANR